MSSKAQIFCGWCGILFVIVMGIGLGPFAQMAPPPSPSIGAAEIANEFRQNAQGILIGSFLANVGVALSIGLVVGISVQIRRMESPESPVLSYLQLATGTTASLFLMLPVMLWNVAAFRDDRSPETILLLHDFATYASFVPFSVATLEALAIGAAILGNRGSEPTFPRWLGYYNIIAGLSYIPMGWVGFFKTGIWASNGFMGWLFPTILVLVWYAVMGIYIIKIEKTRMRLPSPSELSRSAARR